MIVVSDIEFADMDHIQRIPPKEFINSSVTNSFIVNISHDYRYMKMGYYVSVQAELLGDEVYPKSEDTIDVYRPPILLIRAMKAGIKVVPNILTGSVKDVLAEFSLPVLLFPVKPSQTYENTIVKTKGALYNEMKKMTMNGGYVTCVQPLFGELLTFKSIFGQPTTENGDEVTDEGICQLTSQIYEEFKVPLFKFLIQQDKNELFLCAINPFAEDEEFELSNTELSLLTKGIQKLGEKNGQ
jgi:hypothetical protein